LAWATNSFAISRAGTELLVPVGNTIRMILAILLTTCFGKILAPQTSLFLPSKVVGRNFWIFFLEAFGGSCFYLYGLSHSPLALGSTLSALAPMISIPITVVLD
jgi:drug/metabolite transporter (DMT)-like permease